jgi:hypothetical protein
MKSVMAELHYLVCIHKDDLAHVEREQCVQKQNLKNSVRQR